MKMEGRTVPSSGLLTSALIPQIRKAPVNWRKDRVGKGEEEPLHISPFLFNPEKPIWKQERDKDTRSLWPMETKTYKLHLIKMLLSYVLDYFQTGRA